MKYEDLLLELENNIVLCVKQMFNYLSENQIEIFAFAVNISDDLADIDFYANSIKNINHKEKWLIYEFDNQLNNKTETITQITENTKEILEKMEDFYDFFSGENYENVRNDLISICIKAIKMAKNQSEIDTSKIVFFVTMITEDDANEIEKTSSLQLNEVTILEDFHKEFS